MELGGNSQSEGVFTPPPPNPVSFLGEKKVYVDSFAGDTVHISTLPPKGSLYSLNKNHLKAELKPKRIKVLLSSQKV